MEWLGVSLNFIVETLLQEFIVVVFGVLFALFVKNRWEKWRYGKWEVIVIKEEEEILHRKISPSKVKEILDEPAELSVFLKGVASPYEWIKCDLIEYGEKLGLLHEDRVNRRFVLNLDENRKSSKKQPDDLPEKSITIPKQLSSQPYLLLNFGHPLSESQLSQISLQVGQTPDQVKNILTQFNIEQQFSEQVKNLVDQVGLSSDEWQVHPILINPPTLHTIALALIAELHGRMGYFPAIIRLKPLAETAPVQFEVAEIINLQSLRDTARQLRKS